MRRWFTRSDKDFAFRDDRTHKLRTRSRIQSGSCCEGKKKSKRWNFLTVMVFPAPVQTFMLNAYANRKSSRLFSFLRETRLANTAHQCPQCVFTAVFREERLIFRAASGPGFLSHKGEGNFLAEMNHMFCQSWQSETLIFVFHFNLSRDSAAVINFVRPWLCCLPGVATHTSRESIT